ncbi:hypothetical protein GEMRC1_006791 [Eukaryota sp. GEM-RC1]
MTSSPLTNDKQGVVICGPSSAGKGTFIRKLMGDYPFFRHSVSHTTRPPRENEHHGVDYFFVTDDEFDLLKSEGAFIETASVHGYQYGTSYMAINALLDAGFIPLLDVDVQGVKSMRSAGLNFVFVFMYAPLETLKQRLLERNTETSETLETRLRTAEEELKALQTDRHLFDHVMLNDGSVDEGYKRLRELIGVPV